MGAHIARRGREGSGETEKSEERGAERSHRSRLHRSPHPLAPSPVRPEPLLRWLVLLIAAHSVGVGILLTTVDPIMVTEYSVVFSALALPLTYLPILVVANDRTYLGHHVNGRVANTLGTIYLVVVVVASLAAIPLMVVTGAGA